MKKTNKNTDLKGCDLMSDTEVLLNSLHTLDDYPLLASIACRITKATKLDGRACRHIYMTAAPHTDSTPVKSNNEKPSQNALIELVMTFNQAALNHNQFRSALAVCLRTNAANQLQSLVAKHLQAAGSAAPIWAVVISWAAERYSITLERHAERLLRDFLKTVKSEIQEAVLLDLETIEVNVSIS